MSDFEVNQMIEERTAKPTRVAIEELQLHDLTNIDAERMPCSKCLSEDGLTCVPQLLTCC